MGRTWAGAGAGTWAPFVGGLAITPLPLSTVFGGNVVCWGVGCSPDTMLSSHFFGFLSFWSNRFWLGLARDDLGQVGLVGKQTGLPKGGGGDSCPNKRTATDKPETHLLFLSVKRRGRGDLSGRSEKIKPEYKSTVFVGVATPGQGKTRPPCATGCVVPLPGLCLSVGSPVA
jgi:hypothetical protein